MGIKEKMTKIVRDKVQQGKMVAGILDGKVYTGPYIVQIDLTNRCNNNCIACWCNSPLLGTKKMTPGMKKKILPYNLVRKLINDLDSLGVREIELTGGGEPFMHPRIIDIMRYVKSRGIRLGVSTNFTLVDKDIATQLVDIGVDHMNLSLWAATPATYAKLHPNKSQSTFTEIERIIDYFAKLKKQYNLNKPKLGMYNVINVYNFQEVTQMMGFAFKHKMDDITFTPVDTVPGCTDFLMLSMKQRSELKGVIEKIPQIVCKFENEFKHQIKVENYYTFRNRIDNCDAEKGNYDTQMLARLPTCYTGWSFSRILATGDVNSCLKSFKIPVGNIYKESYRQIWFGEKQQEFRSHTFKYDKNDLYFQNMGSDRFSNGQGCIKCCDNLVLNMSLHDKIMALGSITRHFLKTARLLKNDGYK